MEVQLWWALVEDLEPAVAAGEAPLTGDEVARHRRFHFQRDRRAFLARRALERAVLARHAPAQPRHNLASADGLVACVVAAAGGDVEVDVGVDVERLDRSAPLDVVEGAFAPAEAAALRALPPEARPRRFFQHWTLKESYVKARGRGLAIPLDRCAFVLEPGAPVGVTFDPRLEDDAAWWEFRQLQPARDYLAAVAVRRPPGTDVQVVVRRGP